MTHLLQVLPTWPVAAHPRRDQHLLQHLHQLPSVRPPACLPALPPTLPLFPPNHLRTNQPPNPPHCHTAGKTSYDELDTMSRRIVAIESEACEYWDQVVRLKGGLRQGAPASARRSSCPEAGAAEGDPYRMFSRMLRLPNSTGSWLTTAIFSRSHLADNERTRTPSSVITPLPPLWQSASALPFSLHLDTYRPAHAPRHSTPPCPHTHAPPPPPVHTTRWRGK